VQLYACFRIHRAHRVLEARKPVLADHLLDQPSEVDVVQQLVECVLFLFLSCLGHLFSFGISTTLLAIYTIFRTGSTEAFNRPLAKLESELEIANTRNEIKAKTETLPAVPIPLRKDAKTFDTADDVFVQRPPARNHAVFTFALPA